jgi:cystathionine beta-synthase
MKFYENVLGLIGDTPLVRINQITKQHKIKARVLAKMESLNPGYSVKDRIGISMIDWAEKEGVLKKGGIIIEATSGNTGIGLALTAAVRGYKCIFVLTDKVSVEKVRYLKGLGADVVVVPAAAKPGTPEHYHETAARIARETPIRFTRTSTSIRPIRPRITRRPGPRSGVTPRARSRTLSRVSAPAARSAVRGDI